VDVRCVTVALKRKVEKSLVATFDHIACNMVKEFATFKSNIRNIQKNNTRNIEIYFCNIQHGKIMAQYQLTYMQHGAEFHNIQNQHLQHSKITSATSRSNFTTLHHRDLLLQQPRETLSTFLRNLLNTQNNTCNIVKNLLLLAIGTAQSSFADRRASPLARPLAQPGAEG
jgi:hypothetical protein